MKTEYLLVACFTLCVASTLCALNRLCENQ